MTDELLIILVALGLFSGIVIGLFIGANIPQQPKPKDCFYDFDLSYQCSQEIAAYKPNASSYLFPSVENDQKYWSCGYMPKGDFFEQGLIWVVKAC